MKFAFLSISFPEIASEWHPVKNGEVTPNDVMPGTKRKYWWLGKKCNHEWIASPNARTGNGKTNCPYCAGKKVCLENCLAFLFPEIASEWHPSKNGDLTPFDVSIGCGKKVWWYRESCEHEWEVICRDRVSGKGNCPYCCGSKVCLENCLASTHIEIASEWHPSKNGDLTPFDIVGGSHKKIWWYRQICGHEWVCVCKDRTNKKTGCPYCVNQKICQENSLAITHPEIAKEWHPSKNGGLTSFDISYSSRKRIWWIDEFGHEWESYCYNRTSKNPTGCPVCNESKGEKSINKKLINDKIKFYYQYRLDYGGVADFYLPDKNIILEYQGEQHYVPTSFGKDKTCRMENLIIILNRDFKKQLYCQKNKIKLVKIPFWEFDNISEIIDCIIHDKEYQFRNGPKKVNEYQEKIISIVDRLQSEKYEEEKSERKSKHCDYGGD